MEYTPLVIEAPSLQPLRVPAGWKIFKNEFHDLEPQEELRVKGFPDDNGWLLFEKELLVLEHEQTNTYLDLGWNPPYDQKGRFELALVKDENWSYAPVIHGTRDKSDIVEAVNAAMLRISLESSDYQMEGEGLVLQALIIPTGWRVTRNQFFDVVPQPNLKVRSLPNEDEWALFGANMLQLETSFDAEYKVDLSWEPTHDPTGKYIVRLIRHDGWEKPVEQRETRDKDEAVDLIHQLCVE